MDTPRGLPTNTYAVMVLKNYADRVVDFLRSAPPTNKNNRLSSASHGDAVGARAVADEWISCSQALASATAVPMPKTLAAMHDGCEFEDKSALETSSETGNDDVRILDIPALKGVSQARRGYFLVLVPKSRRPIDDISPMARQNIAWIGSIQYSYKYVNDKVGMGDFCHQVWGTCQAHGFDCTKHTMTVQCHPRHLLEPFCGALQATATTTTINDDEGANSFEGPIAMTVSKTKCTHLLTVILVRNDKDCQCTAESAATIAYWGLDDRSKGILSVKLNHFAAQEIIIHPCHNQTGQDESTYAAAGGGGHDSRIDPQTPLSRAYYKLEQVWTDLLQAIRPDFWCHLQSGAAVDLGASPGGWTQVLAHSMRLPVIVAVDSAKLARRVRQLPAVRYVASSLETTNYRKASGGLPYTVLVCDASTLWLTLLEKIQEHVLKGTDWSLPALFVMTLKLPFKTLGSIRRQVEQIYRDTPNILTKMAAIMYPNQSNIEPYFQIVHLMANSVSERTLIAVFDHRGKSRLQA